MATITHSEHHMIQNAIDYTVLTLNICLVAISGESINLITAVLSMIFMIVFRLPKFLFLLSKSFGLLKKLFKGQKISAKDIKDIYDEDTKNEN